jgi:methyltransferase family protein
LEIDLPDNKHAAPQPLPPHVQLIQMGRAHTVPRIIYAAAKLGLADQLASGPKSAAEVAGAMGAHAPSLQRLMRALAGLNILTERPEQRYALTAIGEALKNRCTWLGQGIPAERRQPLVPKRIRSHRLCCSNRQDRF